MLVRYSVLLVAAGILLMGCGPKVLMPPRVDLAGYNKVGFIHYRSNTDGNFDPYLNFRFLEIITRSQQGVQVVELGDRRAVLARVQHRELDYDALLEIGRQYGVEAVLVGDLDISDIRPKISVFDVFSTVRVQADIDAVMSARLVDTRDGATVWAQSARDHKTVADACLFTPSGLRLEARDPNAAYGELVDAIVYKVTSDLRARYVRR